MPIISKNAICLVANCRGRRYRHHALGNVAALYPVQRLQACRINLKVVMLALELFLLLLQAVDLIAVGVGLCDLCQIQQSQQTRQHNEDNRIADRAKCTGLCAKAHRILVAARKPVTVHGQAA